VTHHASSVTDSFLHFECRAPGGSVLISDPVLETRLSLQFQVPIKQFDNVTYETPSNVMALNHDPATRFDKFVLCAGPHPIQGICDSVTHRLGPIVMKDHDVYKYVEAWTTLNYNAAVSQKCDATGTAPTRHAIFGTKVPAAEVVSGEHE
jgi:hypothetical protein